MLLLANLEIGYHEQTRLQPEIVAALDAPIYDPAELRRRLLAELFPDPTARMRLSLLRLLGRATPSSAPRSIGRGASTPGAPGHHGAVDDAAAAPRADAAAGTRPTGRFPTAAPARDEPCAAGAVEQGRPDARQPVRPAHRTGAGCRIGCTSSPTCFGRITWMEHCSIRRSRRTRWPL